MISETREAFIKRGVWLPDKDLSWFEEGEDLFDGYVEAVLWAQDFARANRKVMMERPLKALRDCWPKPLRKFRIEKGAVNRRHNYGARELHLGADVWVTRKGAVRAGEGELGIIPGSIGAKS